MLSSNTPNPVRPVGSAVNLTCTVYVDFSTPVDIDIPVAVNIVVFQLHGILVTNASQLVTGGSTVYTFTAVVSSFGRDQSGSYRCRATLHPTSTNTYIHRSFAITDVIRLTTGETIFYPLIIIHRFICYIKIRYLFSIGKSSHC